MKSVSEKQASHLQILDFLYTSEAMYECMTLEQKQNCLEGKGTRGGKEKGRGEHRAWGRRASKQTRLCGNGFK